MSTKKEAYAKTFMQTLAGGDGIELNPRLAAIFSGVLQRQLEEDDDGNITAKGSFETLAKVFTYISTPQGDRPFPPLTYAPDLLQEARDAADSAAGGGGGGGDDTATPVSVDIGMMNEDNSIEWGLLDAASDSFVFTDDSKVTTFAAIENFTADDQIKISNLPDGAEYSFHNDWTDIHITYNYNDTGVMNHIKLLGVGSESFDPFDDEAGFEAAVGFDAITYA
jgi:hypothetical protein